MILALRPLLGGAAAERWAVGDCAASALSAADVRRVALTARRLVDRTAYPLALLALFFAGSTYGMYHARAHRPSRLAARVPRLGLARLPIRKRVRGGIVLGVSSALSLAIGLEMLIYLALVAAAMALFWVDDRDERDAARSLCASRPAAGPRSLF